MQTCTCTGYDVSTLLRAVDEATASGLRPTLAIVFCSVVHDVAALGRSLAERGLAVVGATTAGEIAGAEVLEEACAVLLLEMDPAAFQVHYAARVNGTPMEALAGDLGRAATAAFARPAVLAFASGLTTDGETVLRGVHTGAGRPIPLFGGLAGDDLTMQNSYVFSGDGATADGLIGLVLDGDRFQVEGIATSGWQPVGIPKTITHSEGNVVYAIDGEPALDVYKKYLKLDMEVGQGRHVNIAEALGVQYPLSVQREDGTAVIRAPLLFDSERNALIFAGGVPEGATVHFCIPPSLDVVERVLTEAADVQQRLPDADALILISCKARHMALGPLVEDEIQGLNDLWDAPLLGYFSYGEIGAREPEHCDFHNETCTLVALREVRA